MDAVGTHIGTPLADRDLETHVSDRLQVFREPLGELLDRAHVEGETEVLGEAVEGDVEVTRQGTLDPGLVPDIDLVALKEDGFVGLVDVQRCALHIGL